MMSASEYRRLQPTLYRLQGYYCLRCLLIISGRQCCPQCRSESLEPVALARNGTVIAVTVVHKPPLSRRRAGKYSIAIIKLSDGAKILSQITDTRSRPVQAGDHVHAVFRKLYEPDREDFICYGIKFRGDKVETQYEDSMKKEDLNE